MNQAVQALNASNIVVEIPEVYKDDPVEFVSNSAGTAGLQSRARIARRDQSTHGQHRHRRRRANRRRRDLAPQHCGRGQRNRLHSSRRSISSSKNRPSCSRLVDALNALKVPNADAIEIIKGIDRSGKLHARLIIDQ